MPDRILTSHAESLPRPESLGPGPLVRPQPLARAGTPAPSGVPARAGRIDQPCPTWTLGSTVTPSANWTS
jgi:hypothetical protein